LDGATADLLREQWIEKEFKDPERVERYIQDLDFEHLFVTTSKRAALKIETDQEQVEVKSVMVVINERATRSYSKFSIIQENERGRIVGGSTFIVQNLR
jgi:hypothetical protein